MSQYKMHPDISLSTSNIKITVDNILLTPTNNIIEVIKLIKNRDTKVGDNRFQFINITEDFRIVTLSNNSSNQLDNLEIVKRLNTVCDKQLIKPMQLLNYNRK